MKTPILLLLAVIATLQSGCVVGRRTLSLSVPELPPPSASRGDVAVVSVLDRRAFENKPSEPSTPSIDGDVNTLSAAQKASMIGRQRNGFGRAIGDISLPGGQSVPQVVRRLVEEALKHRGYRVTSSASGATASVAINEFWAWMSPGAFALGFKAKVDCTITLRKGGRSAVIVVSGFGINNGQFAKNENWREAYEIAFRDFLKKFDAAAAQAGF
jgi:hypothetical protein